jgi:hypothetical protein
MRVRIVPSFVLRAAVLWLLLRTVLLAVGSGAGALLDEPLSNAERLTFSPLAMLLATAVTVVLVLVDVAAMHEQAFQANLGNDKRSIMATAFVSALGLEVLAALLVPVVLA